MPNIEARLVQLRDEHDLPIVPRVSSPGVIMSDGTTLETYIAAHGGGKSYVLRNTMVGWNSQPDLIASENIIYVYIDYKRGLDGNLLPGIKIGDGVSLLKDIPFISELYDQHIENTSIHVSAADRTNWNNKISLESVSNENATFIKGGY